jgi:cyclopropane-fatty-acyl-phospholipid synthase
MATQADIAKTYDWIDEFHELRLGPYADFSCAFFDGNFNITLDQAQRNKHEWVFTELGIKGPGSRILDIGCGWGPILNAIRERGGVGLGLTLSPAQAEYCANHGLNVKILDWKQADPRVLGRFDAVICIGAFEHFCSPEEFARAEQQRIYKDFFDFCAEVLPVHGRLFLQTMTWGKVVPVLDTLTSDAPEGTTERILARLRKFYPGSWGPSGKDQIEQSASRHFQLLKSNNGRNDYIETINRWGEGTKSLFSIQKLFNTVKALMKLAPLYLADQDFRTQISSIYHNDQQECFLREIMTHERMFFEKLR